MYKFSLMAGAVVLVTAVLAASSCSENNQSSNGPHTHSPAELTLNDGKKWQADQHTRESMRGIRQAMTTKPVNSPDEMRNLGLDLQRRLKELVSGCTMTGEAHNQLHVVLEEFIPAADSLASQQDEEKARETLAEMYHMLEHYDEHFE
ncbi:MAG: hypothetical protein R3E76_15255 [Planctomycetota bacterium]